MKRAGIWRLMLLIGIPFLLANCGGRFIDWGRCQFNQGCPLPNNYDCVQEYIRSVRVYDQFTTMGIFNALWLAPAVREASLDMKVIKFAMPDQDKNLALKTIEKDTQQYISFYILAHQPRWMGTIFGKPDAEWNLLLDVNGVKHKPLEVKKIDVEDLDMTYAGYFGERLNRHKTIFFVRFAATEPGGKSLFTPETDSITLCIRALKRQVALSWQLCNGPEQILLPFTPCGGGCNESGTRNCGPCQLCPATDCGREAGLSI